MTYSSEAIASLKQAERFDMQIGREAGRVKDLERDNVIVHVGKPIGSTTGWVGAYFWQVWVEYTDAPGQVHARIDSEPSAVWAYDAAMTIPLRGRRDRRQSRAGFA